MMQKTDNKEDFRSWWAKQLSCKGMVQFGEFTLKSGELSPIYLNLRNLVGSPWMLTVCARLCEELLRDKGIVFDRILGLPLGGLPSATALSMQTLVPLVYTRASKGYGVTEDTGEQVIEGPFFPTEKALMFDDVISTAITKLEALDTATKAGLEVTDVLVLIDRSGKSASSLAERGVTLHSLYTLPELLGIWRMDSQITEEQENLVLEFLDK